MLAGYHVLGKLAVSFYKFINSFVFQDCVAFSIQQLIQIYDITTDPGSQTAGGKLWRRFSEEVQEIMLPLMHSK